VPDRESSDGQKRVLDEQKRAWSEAFARFQEQAARAVEFMDQSPDDGLNEQGKRQLQRLVQDSRATLASLVDSLLGRSEVPRDWWLDIGETIAPGVLRQKGTGVTGEYQVKFDAVFVVDGEWPAADYGLQRIGASTSATIWGGELPGRVTIVLGVSEGDAPRLFVKELSVQSDSPIRTTTLRGLSIPDLVRIALAVISPRLEIAELATPPRSHRGQGRVLDDDQLAAVARVYRENPKRGFMAVAEHFNIGRSTAGDYIKRARAAGHLVEED
jgi:hypothetical protein